MRAFVGRISAAFWAILFGWNADLWINVLFFVCGVPLAHRLAGAGCFCAAVRAWGIAKAIVVAPLAFAAKQA
jgi:hypothetical protein